MSDGNKKTVAIDMSDFSGGINSVEHPLRIGGNQVQPESCGFILKKSGVEKYPGATGLTASTTFTTYLKMLSMYRDFGGTERLLALSGGVLYDVDYSGAGIGSLTSLYSLTGTGEGWSCDSHGKHWVVNGSAGIKVESGTAYRIGIAPPAGVTAAASAGAGLADGVYTIYASYGRRVSSVDKLYSSGQYVGSVTLGGGNNRITISDFANSADPQVGQKVIWIKSPSEVIHYFFYATNDNATTTFIISSASAKNTSLVYEYSSADNGLPPTSATFIYAFSNRIWMIASNVIYYSNKAFNEYDLEKFGAANYIIMPYQCTGIFSVGYNLYINTDNGIIVIPNADPTAVSFLIEPRWNFYEMRTVARWNNGVIGLTNDGIRIFDGSKFTDYDISFNIKNYVDKIYSQGTNFKACGYVYRRSMRNEYHLMWQDNDISTSVNNKHAVLNLDSMMFISSAQNQIAWEFQPYSGNYCAVSKINNAVFVGQSHASASKIFYESPDNDVSIYVYDKYGTLLSTNTTHECIVKSKVIMPDIASICWFYRVYCLHMNIANFTIRVYVPDKFQKDSGDKTISTSVPDGGSNFVWDETNWDESYWPIENASVTKKKLKDSLKGKTCYIEIKQTANDPKVKVMQVTIEAVIERSNFL